MLEDGHEAFWLALVRTLFTLVRKLFICCSLFFAVKSPLEKTRYDTSLGLLTKKFVGLLTSASDGVSAVK